MEVMGVIRLAPVKDCKRKFSRLTPTRSGFKNQGSKTKTAYKHFASLMAAQRLGLSCNLSPFLNQKSDFGDAGATFIGSRSHTSGSPARAYRSL